MTARVLIGQQIREARIDQKLTQQELADISGYRRATITKIESGKFNVSIDKLAPILEALNYEIMIKPK